MYATKYVHKFRSIRIQKDFAAHHMGDVFKWASPDAQHYEPYLQFWRQLDHLGPEDEPLPGFAKATSADVAALATKAKDVYRTMLEKPGYLPSTWLQQLVKLIRSGRAARMIRPADLPEGEPVPFKVLYTWFRTKAVEFMQRLQTWELWMMALRHRYADQDRALAF